MLIIQACITLTMTIAATRRTCLKSVEDILYKIYVFMNVHQTLDHGLYEQVIYRCPFYCVPGHGSFIAQKPSICHLLRFPMTGAILVDTTEGTSRMCVCVIYTVTNFLIFIYACMYVSDICFPFRVHSVLQVFPLFVPSSLLLLCSGDESYTLK